MPSVACSSYKAVRASLPFKEQTLKKSSRNERKRDGRNARETGSERERGDIARERKRVRAMWRLYLLRPRTSSECIMRGSARIAAAAVASSWRTW